MLENLFPGLKETSFRITSPATANYNCIAWAVGDSSQIWWPDPLKIHYWPRQAPRSGRIEWVVEMFRELQFHVCEEDTFEESTDRIALFGLQGSCLHVARQIGPGLWTSKLGKLQDIEHELRALEGTEYGRVMFIMKRAQIR